MSLPLLFRRDEQHRHPTYYLVSRREPENTDGLWLIETKPYAPRLRKGQLLAFSLRANPVVTRSDEHGKQRRDDLIMDKKKRLDWKNLPETRRPPLAQLIQEAGEQWLDERQERLGLHVDSLRADTYRRHRNQKRGQKNPIRYSCLDLQGNLSITDEKRFRNALLNGIGRAKAFGCGPLLVRRV